MRAVLTTDITIDNGVRWDLPTHTFRAGTAVTVWAEAVAGDAQTLVVTDGGTALRVGPYDWEVV